MTGKRLLLHALFLLLLPVIVAWLGISTAGAIALVLLALLWRWAISLSAILAPARIPDLELETISASHFVEKVRWCMDRLGVAGASESGVDAAALMDELEAERVANAQLEERVRAIKEKQETTMAGLEGQVTRLKAQVESRDGELSRLKAVGDELRRSNQALREANASALPDADLVNGSLAAEVEALRAARAADRAEIDDILATLDPVLKEA